MSNLAGTKFWLILAGDNPEYYIVYYLAFAYQYMIHKDI